jgi:tetratricopeptide (TPR) repeat protein
MIGKLLKYLILCCLGILFISSYLWAASVADIEKEMLNENYAAAVTTARTVLDRPLSLNEKRKANYLVGVCYLKLANGTRAREYFKKGISDKADTITLNCLLATADSYYIEAQYEQAIKRYDYILSKYKKIPNEANITYKIAQSYYSLGDWTNSKKYFKKTKNNYSDSFEAEFARNILNKNCFYYTVQVGSFGNKVNADKLLKRLKKNKYPVFIDETKDNFNTFYRVRVGKFSKLQEAKKYEQSLKKDGLPTKIYP